MLNYWNKIRLDKLNEEGASGGGGNFPDPKEKPPVTPNTPPAEEGGDKEYDDLGYEIEKKPNDPPATKPGDKKPDAKPDKKAEEKKADDKVEDPATGYGDEPPKVDPPPAPPEKKKDDPPAELDELDKALEGLPKEEVGKWKKFAEENKVTPEVAKKFAEARKAELAADAEFVKNAQKESERKLLQQRADWHKQLKEDKTFGGENFAKSIHSVEKVLGEFMPETKKKLTETKGMLPPYVMRDLAKLHEHLYKQESLVTGDQKTGGTKEDQTSDDPLDFYE